MTHTIDALDQLCAAARAFAALPPDPAADFDGLRRETQILRAKAARLRIAVFGARDIFAESAEMIRQDILPDASGATRRDLERLADSFERVSQAMEEAL